MNDTVVARLAEALVFALTVRGLVSTREGADSASRHVAAALLPVVREIADQRAAKELDKLAARISRSRPDGWAVPASMASARAAALRGATDA